MTPILESGSTADGTRNGLSFVDRDCNYYLSIYPNQDFENEFRTPTPWILLAAVSGVLLFAILMFFVYDRLVVSLLQDGDNIAFPIFNSFSLKYEFLKLQERRQSLVLQKAVQSSAIVSSLFPKNVRDRLMKVSDNANSAENNAVTAFRDRMRTNNVGKEDQDRAKNSGMYIPEEDDGQTIADLFPNCTVLFADIAVRHGAADFGVSRSSLTTYLHPLALQGFTAWSSTREPSQVFTLLQNLYSAFDKIALRRSVFKVETIGDSCKCKWKGQDGNGTYFSLT